MSSVAALWALQETDLAVEGARRRLTEIDQLLGETPELLAARRQVAESEAELATWQDQQREVEVQVRDLTGRIRSAEQQLMSGRVRNPKELEGMQANVAALRRRRASLEDQVLEAMLESDRYREELAAHRVDLAQVEDAWQAEQANLTAERQALAAELQGLAIRLNHQWQATSDQDKDLYRSLRQRKAGRALALLQQNTCQACGVGVATGIAQQVRASQQHTYCPSCGRLLHSQG